MAWLLLLIIIPYLYLLFKICGRLVNIKPYRPSETTDIFVSVIIACRNEEKLIPLIIDDIISQEYNPDYFELIIVDDNSTDHSYQIAKGYNNIKNLIVLKNKGTGKKKGIRTGVEASRGSFIVTTDADCRMNEKWLKTIVSFYQENNRDMLICPVMLEYHGGFPDWFQELEFLSLQGITAGTAAEGNPVMCNGANLAFRKEVYERHASDLHEELISGDDVFLLHNIKRESGKIAWLESENASVTTRTEPSLKSFLIQRARWISKAGSYNDSYSIILAIVTLLTILFQLSMLILGFFNIIFLLIFLTAFILKSIPDFLILLNRALRHKKKNLLWFFLPGEIIYPFYVTVLFIYYLFTRSGYFIDR
jgi:biofilm PGA synthesis N-glycosyltransferase PgaC